MSLSESAAALTGIGETRALLAQAVMILREGITIDYIWQLIAFGFAVAASWILSQKVNAWLRTLLPPEGRNGAWDKMEQNLVGIATQVSFSVIAASVLVPIVWSLGSANILLNVESIVFTKLGCMLFYLFALWRVLIYMLRGMLGDRILTPRVTKFVTGLFWVVVLMGFAGFLPEVAVFMKAQSVPVGGEDLSLWTVFTGIVSAFLTIGLANWLANVLETAFTRARGLAPNLRIVLARVCRWALLLIAILVALGIVGINLAVLSVFGGAVGVGIGFGLQKIASNYVSGFIILLDRSIRIGDYIEIGSFAGTVLEINTRYTVVRDNSGVANIVPNETFVTSSVKNYYYSDNACVLRLEVGISYESDVVRAMGILREEATRPGRVLKDRNNWVGVAELADSQVTLAAGVWVPDIGSGTMGLKTEIITNVMRRFAEEGIEIPYPKLDLNVVKTPDAG